MSENWISPCKSNRRGNIRISQVEEQGRREEEGQYSHSRILCSIVQRRESYPAVFTNFPILEGSWDLPVFCLHALHDD